MAKQFLLLLAIDVMASLTTAAVDITTIYHVIRQPKYDVIKNVTSQAACLEYESAKWTDGVCRCYINHVFYVLNEKPGCFGSQQIDSKCELSQDLSMTQNLLTQNEVDLIDGIDSRVNCTRKYMDYNTNGEWRYVSDAESNKIMELLSGKVLRLTYECDSMAKCLVMKVPGNDFYKLTISRTTTTVTTPSTNTTHETSTNTTTTPTTPTTDTTTTTTVEATSPQKKRVIPTKSTEQKEMKRKLMIALVVCAVLLAGVVILAVIMARRYLKIKKMTTDSEVARLHSPRTDQTTMETQVKK